MMRPTDGNLRAIAAHLARLDDIDADTCPHCGGRLDVEPPDEDGPAMVWCETCERQEEDDE